MNWKHYFVFTRKERIGVIIILVLLVTINTLPYVLPEKDFDISIQDVEVQEQRNGITELARKYSRAPVVATTAPGKFESFYFDPNVLDERGWKRLGLRDKTISTIVNFRSKGGKFREPGDLKKVYGIRSDELQRLLPLIRINVGTTTAKSFVATTEAGEVNERRKTNRNNLTDINTADTSDFIALPGIGSKLATRIVQFREKLGGFLNVEQVKEVYGLKDSVFQALRQYLTCTSSSLKKIDINNATIEQLQQHPYVSKTAARIIVHYRQQHGRYESVEQLRELAGINPEEVRKFLNYVAVEQPVN